MFDSVLVANRGEIAVRIIRTLGAMGVRAIAVYSDADRDAEHVRAADDARWIGPADARSSYLDIGRVVAAAVGAGAQAVHPGYGFLSENADFARACADAGLVFIGPDAHTIALMGDKRAAKDAVAPLGVPLVPGFAVGGATDDEVAARCQEAGLPVIVKPAAGGGGTGMRVVHDLADLPSALAGARREAMAAFGDDSLLVERFVPRARHVEVQVLGDGHGGAIHLGDRDCSLQRRHQKVVEEAPAHGLDPAVRDRMRADSVAIARAFSYRGVGTVEFLLDADRPDSYHFLEMNTRLQVEHPVTELVTGLDLVELQLLVAAGGALPLAQHDVRIEGHAVEARVYAEDGHRGFLPASGTVLAYAEPRGARVDSGVRAGTEVGTSYDPLLLKVIARGRDRAAALDALDAALADTVVLGVAHNIGALRTLVGDPAVRRGEMTTSLIGDLGLGAAGSPDPHRDAAAALALSLALAADDVWTARPGWRVGDPAPVARRLVDEQGRGVEVTMTGPPRACLLGLDGGEGRPASVLGSLGAEVVVTVDGITRTYGTVLDRSGREPVLWLGSGGDAWHYRVPGRTALARPGDDAAADGELRSPMPGSVVLVARAPGDAVREGEVVVVVEAMKMEYPLVSPFEGTVAALSVAPGAQVVRDQVLAVIHPSPDAPGEGR